MGRLLSTVQYKNLDLYNNCMTIKNEVMGRVYHLGLNFKSQDTKDFILYMCPELSSTYFSKYSYISLSTDTYNICSDSGLIFPLYLFYHTCFDQYGLLKEIKDEISQMMIIRQPLDHYGAITPVSPLINVEVIDEGLVFRNDKYLIIGNRETLTFKGFCDKPMILKKEKPVDLINLREFVLGLLEKSVLGRYQVLLEFMKIGALDLEELRMYITELKFLKQDL